MQKKYRFLLSASSFVLIAAAVVGIGYGLCRYVHIQTSLNDTAAVVAEYTKSLPNPVDATEYTISKEALIDIKGLQSENPDVFGFLNIPETAVSYPVMRSETPEYYLTHDFYKNRSACGSIYIDPACYENGSVLLLHGHNMKNGSIFGSLKRYLDADYQKEHSMIQYSTVGRMDFYQICAVFTGSVDDTELMTCLIPYTKQEFFRLKDKIIAGGVLNEDFTWDDNLIILSTCYSRKKNGRLYVVGKRINTMKMRDVNDNGQK